MLENVKYNRGRECELYAIIPLGQRSKGETEVAIKKGMAHKRLNIRTALQASSSGGLHGKENKKNNMLNISTPTDLVTGEDMRDLLEHLAAPMILQINNRPNTY